MRKRYAEDGVQKAIVRYLRINGFLFTSTGAGLIKSMRTQMVMKALGYLTGTPDLIVWIGGGTLNIECKAPKTMRYSAKTDRMVVNTAGGRQSDSQKEFEESVKQIRGHHYIVASDPMDVVKYIQEHGIKPI